MKRFLKAMKRILGFKKKGRKKNNNVAVEETGTGKQSSNKYAVNVNNTDTKSETTNKKTKNIDIKGESVLVSPDTTRIVANTENDRHTQNKAVSTKSTTKEKLKDGDNANGKSRQVIVTKGSKEGAVEVTTEESNLKADKNERDALIGKDVTNFNMNAVGDFENEVFQDSPKIVESYNKIPILQQTDLPRGGLSIDTEAVGRVQFGIPPETIKDSMSLGIAVPKVYIVPVERFCREMGPALGVNLAEFEFPAYFNFFIHKSKCILIVDSDDAEDNIRRVFSETLLGPIQFRRKENPLTHEESDFAPGFDRKAIPNFQKELGHFRLMPDGSELCLENLLQFCHFNLPSDGHDNLGVPPPSEDEQDQSLDHQSFVSEEEILDAASDDEEEISAVQMTAEGVEKRREEKSWSYSRARFMGDVASVWPSDTTDEQKRKGGIPRIEIFKMPGGTEYILHDIDEKNFIIGKARFSGHVKVKETIGVIGYEEGNEESKKTIEKRDGRTGGSRESFVLQTIMPKKDVPRAFYPPSFGVTVLGNSNGFDNSGSVSGYVLWINGRGIMIDPPPYSSATLEREGIKPRMIVGIILTHCHADHDAGAFQKVLTGAQVVVITTPTIYKSFIRKYAALSALSPALLRHCHRYKAAIIGQKLRFQGASFEFIYTLHAIPCIGFKVTWRRRSMVFTGDHLNHPVTIDKLQYRGILSKARADDLRNLPLQDTDLLLHETGVPPLHSPLDVLMKLPERIKKRMYVVHTSKLPPGCDLRVAPTGTAGTIRLDQMDKSKAMLDNFGNSKNSIGDNDAEDMFIWHDANNEYHRENQTSSSSPDDELLMATSFANLAYDKSKDRTSKDLISNSLNNSGSNFSQNKLPLVSLRPASSSDAWFTLNLLSSVPFLSSLSYSSTMEVLETARVDTFYPGEIVVHADIRPKVVCVVWEGTCAERPKFSGAKQNLSSSLCAIEENREDVNDDSDGAVWYAGDWTAPIALQPEKSLSSESYFNSTHNVVAVSKEGVKVITIDFEMLDIILRNGSTLYSKYLERSAQQTMLKVSESVDGERDEQQSATELLLGEALRNLNILDLLNCNSAFRKLTAVQKRHLECLAEGPVSFLPGERIWRAGAPVEKAFIIVSGTASFVPRRRNAGSVVLHRKSGTQRQSEDDGDTPKSSTIENNKAEANDSNIGEEMVINAIKAIKELGSNQRLHEDSSIDSSLVDDRKEKEDEKKKKGTHIHFDHLFKGNTEGAAVANENPEYAKVSRDLQRRAEKMFKAEHTENHSLNSSLGSSDQQEESDYSFGGDSETDCSRDRDRRVMLKRRRSSKARFANKVLGRLYSRRAFTGGLIFSRGHFLGDISKMVAGLLSADATYGIEDESAPSYGFGEQPNYGRRQTKEEDGLSVNLAELVIHEREGDQQVMHNSTLTAGKDGCVVLVFNRSLIPFLDEYPGLLLSLLGTQVIV